MTSLPENRAARGIITAENLNLTYNFAAALPGRASSPHTQRAYFRWVDHYLVEVAGLKPTKAQDRVNRMHMLPVATLQTALGTQQFRAWLGRLARQGHGKQGLDQARAAIVTLTDLFAEAGWFDEPTAAAMARVRPPRAEDGQRPGRWLSLEQIRVMMAAGREIATTPNQSQRNNLVLLMLCTMALRREELSVARWGDLSIQNDRPVLLVHGKARKVATIDVPRPVVRTLESWQRVVASGEAPPLPESRIIRRIWKGGAISKGGLSADGIWLIVDRAASYGGIGHVAPHDLRRSVAGALNEAGTPIEQISRLLRHSNVAVTERYLNRLPHANRGAVVMSDILGLGGDDDWADWPGFES